MNFDYYRNIFYSKLKKRIQLVENYIEKRPKNIQTPWKLFSHPLYKTYVQLQNKGLDILNHIDTIFLWREVTVSRIWKVRYLGSLKHAQVWRVLWLVFWGLRARRQDVVVGGPGPRWGRVAEGYLVVELVAVGSQVVTVVTAVCLVHWRTVEVLHLEEWTC